MANETISVSDVRNSSTDKFALRIFVFLILLYAINAVYAVSAQRHLFADTSWFFVHILQTGHIFHYNTTLHQLYVSRIVGNWITQLPVVVALRAGVHNLHVLSWILGAGYFGTKVLSLMLSYKLLDSNKKKYILFVLFALFGGTINSDLFIVSESHVAVSFLWPIAILITKNEPITAVKEYVAYIAVVAAAFTYESWAFFSLVLIILGAITVKSTSGHQRTIRVVITLLLIVPACTNWAAILYPRDAANEGGFLQGVIKAFADSQNGFVAWHSGLLASAAAISVFAIALVWKRDIFRTPVAMFLFCIATIAILIIPPLHVVLSHSGEIFNHSIEDRGFSCLATQLVLLVLYIGCLHTRFLGLSTNFTAACIVLISLALAQLFTQFLATQTWRQTIDATQATLNAHIGPTPCAAIDKFAHTSDRTTPSNIVCAWWAPSISILFSRHDIVQSILIPRNQVFAPFDPLIVTQLPKFIYGGPDYSKYTTHVVADLHIHPGTHLVFTSGSPYSILLGPGFSYPETWATWTDGDKAQMHLCIGAFGKNGRLDLLFKVLPLLNRKRPDLPVSVQLPDGAITHWNFKYGEPNASERSVTLFSDRWPSSKCGTIIFKMPPSLRSPLEMGISQDPRKLGFALIEANVRH